MEGQARVERWGDERIGDVMAVLDAAMPEECLTEDDVRSVLFDDPDPACVFGMAGTGVVAAVLRTTEYGPVAYVQVVAVVPGRRRSGIGKALLDAAHRWAFDELGTQVVVAGGASPFYLWPGVDVLATPALCLFESLGYGFKHPALDMVFPSRFRAPVPEGVEVRRVLGDADAEATLAFVAGHWPSTTWIAECGRGIEHGACHMAVDAASGAVAGFGCHSVNRLGTLGPIGTDPGRRRSGIGAALVSAIATDVMVAGIEQVQVSWVGPQRFYAKVAGATTSRAYVSLLLERPSSA